ncbi:carboxypeptidase-like regulatory domain-containing protein [Youngiibacter fragilis]|uniref:Carboxypeptidase regulatory-like domain-containing protein n=1 Tax=Youngiibacter fragilis 232.1 TaxID=994573 RepID=V7I5Z8_9CLOT|nr:carboxypeptidase-like regulatory domain-containing protein [Youngiibacter fragilis]ETA81630.1 hypothetical protein T472_0205420 [Youngiibacter fragilis 232.1]
MKKIHGKVTDYKGKPLQGAEVLFLDRAQNIIATGYSDNDGYYFLQTEEKTNGSILCTHNYGVTSLGFSFYNITSDKARDLDIRLGEIEFLDFKKFLDREKQVIRISFRPVSLKAINDKIECISPDRFTTEIELLLNGKKQKCQELEVEKEIKDDKCTDRYNLILELPKGYDPKSENILEILMNSKKSGEKGTVWVVA